MNNKTYSTYEALYLYILSLLPIRKLDIYEQYRMKAGSFEKIYFATEEELTEFGFGPELIIKFRRIKQEHSVEKLSQSLHITGVNTITYQDTRYPKILKEIYDPPPVLFWRGALFEQEEICISIVGSRKMSNYGATIIPKITQPLIRAGVTIVSGLAYGIDGAAHNECIKNQSRTIAVLGSGVDSISIYPRAHYRLSEQILEHGGLIISEQPPGTPGFKQNFIARNRVIAGLSLGVIIVEAKSKSGALLTADYANDFNRNVYAVPGPIYSPLSAGPHQLIQTGASLVCNGEEVLKDLQITHPHIENKANRNNTSQLNETEMLVLKCIQVEPLSMAQLLETTSLSVSVLTQTLTILELRGFLKTSHLGFTKT